MSYRFSRATYRSKKAREWSSGVVGPGPQAATATPTEAIPRLHDLVVLYPRRISRATPDSSHRTFR